MSNLDTLTGLVGDASSQHKSLQDDAKKLSEKWEKTGLLEGLDGYDKNSMSILLENQAKQLVTESSRTGTASNSEEWSGVALPLVRRVFAEIAAKDFVSVQPMNLPSGLVFFLDFKYGTAQPGLMSLVASLVMGLVLFTVKQTLLVTQVVVYMVVVDSFIL